MNIKLLNFALLLIVLLPLASCSEIELASHLGKKMTGSTAKSVGKYKVGSPYTIKGKRYYPEVDYGYNETGIASWYGPGFHGKLTANGEIFDQNELTAAHKTLPLPSIVRVTNLENGKSLVLRVNDRGPYAHGRIIDLSKRSAELLGFKNKGVAKVRVQVLEAQSKHVENMAKQGKDTKGVEVAMNRPSYKAPKIHNAGYQQQPAPVQKATLTSTNAQTIPGHMKNGSFYPDEVITEYPVQKATIFVQVASLTSREAAMKFASGLDNIGRAQIYDAVVHGQQYYRVRFPAKSVPDADAILERVTASGYKDALIVVD